MPRFKDISKKQFGRLVAIEYSGRSSWRCMCDCGAVTTVATSNLTSGNTTSCGCALRESRFSHGMSKHRMHSVWRSMRARCNNPNDPSYRNYGGRGVRVCERWADFASFIADMGMRPSGYDIDRIDNDGNYEPGNCRWVTREVNLNNTRNNRNVTWKGETLSVAMWARRLGMNERTLSNRISRGWSMEQAMTAPRHARGKRRSKET
jgi:hypothetical protein